MKRIRLMPDRLHVYPLWPRSKSPIFIPESARQDGDSTKVFHVLGVAPNIKEVKEGDWVVWQAYGNGGDVLPDKSMVIKMADVKAVISHGPEEDL